MDGVFNFCLGLLLVSFALDLTFGSRSGKSLAWVDKLDGILAGLGIFGCLLVIGVENIARIFP